MSSTRSFLDDPCERMGTWARKAGPRRSDAVQEYDNDDGGETEAPTADYAVSNAKKWAPQPHVIDVRVCEQVMQCESPLVESLVNHAINAHDAFLVLRYEDTTSSVRAFTTLASAAVEQPREVAFSLLQNGSKVKLRSAHPMYPALMWPLLFPGGQPLPYRKDGRVLLYDVRDDRSTAAVGALAGLGADTHGGRKECWSIAQMALALLHQPEKRAGSDSIVWHPTESPYPSEALAPIQRPFSKLALCGRLGDEVLLDMSLSAEDARLHYLTLPSVQRRITGQFQGAAETADDADALSKGSYLPPTVQGAPRQLRECIANALTAVNEAPCKADEAHGPHSDPLLFDTMTVSQPCS